MFYVSAWASSRQVLLGRRRFVTKRHPPIATSSATRNRRGPHPQAPRTRRAGGCAMTQLELFPASTEAPAARAPAVRAAGGDARRRSLAGLRTSSKRWPTSASECRSSIVRHRASSAVLLPKLGTQKPMPLPEVLPDRHGDQAEGPHRRGADERGSVPLQPLPMVQPHHRGPTALTPSRRAMARARRLPDPCLAVLEKAMTVHEMNPRQRDERNEHRRRIEKVSMNWCSSARHWASCRNTDLCGFCACWRRRSRGRSTTCTSCWPRFGAGSAAARALGDFDDDALLNAPQKVRRPAERSGRRREALNR